MGFVLVLTSLPRYGIGSPWLNEGHREAGTQASGRSFQDKRRLTDFLLITVSATQSHNSIETQVCKCPKISRPILHAFPL